MEEKVPDDGYIPVCPSCKRPVAPGARSCDACGAKIPALLTCSGCGTQFVHPKKYCDCCGALFVPREIAGPAAAHVPEPEDRDAAEPVAGEFPDPTDEEWQEPEEQEDRDPAESNAGEIPDPTDEEWQEPEEQEEPEVRDPAEPVAGEIPDPTDEEWQEPEEQEEQEDRDPAEPVAGEIPDPTDEEWQEPEEEEEPGERAVPEPDFEGPPRLAGNEMPERKDDGPRIPDTQELLETYGKDYDDDETLDSSRSGKKPLRKTRRDRADAGSALVPGKRGRALANRPAGTLRAIAGGGAALVVVFAALYFFGLPMLSGSDGPGAAETAVPVITPGPDPYATTQAAPAGTTAAVTGAFATKPTETVPGQQYYFVVRKDPITLKISVIFIGSASSNTIDSAEVKVSRPDGAVGTGVILPLKGVSEIFLDGSDGEDRVEIVAKTASGDTYRVYDALVSPLA